MYVQFLLLIICLTRLTLSSSVYPLWPDSYKCSSAYNDNDGIGYRTSGPKLANIEKGDVIEFKADYSKSFYQTVDKHSPLFTLRTCSMLLYPYYNNGAVTVAYLINTTESCNETHSNNVITVPSDAVVLKQYPCHSGIQATYYELTTTGDVLLSADNTAWFRVVVSVKVVEKPVVIDKEAFLGLLIGIPVIIAIVILTAKYCKHRNTTQEIFNRPDEIRDRRPSTDTHSRREDNFPPQYSSLPTAPPAETESSGAAPAYSEVNEVEALNPKDLPPPSYAEAANMPYTTPHMQ